MVLADKQAKQVQWTNVYLDALVCDSTSPKCIAVKETSCVKQLNFTCIFIYCGIFNDRGMVALKRFQFGNISDLEGIFSIHFRNQIKQKYSDL